MIYISSQQKLCRTRSTQKPCFFTCQRLLSCCSRVLRAQIQKCRGHRSQRPWIQVLQARSCSQPTWIRKQWKSMQNFANKNDPTCIRTQWECSQNFKHESANMNQKPLHKQLEPLKKMQTTKQNQGSSTRPAEQHQKITRCSHHGIPPPPHGSLRSIWQRWRPEIVRRPPHLQGSRKKTSQPDTRSYKNQTPNKKLIISSRPDPPELQNPCHGLQPAPEHRRIAPSAQTSLEW